MMSREQILASIEDKPMLIHPQELLSGAEKSTTMQTIGDIWDEAEWQGKGSVNGTAIIPVYGGLYHGKYTYLWAVSSYGAIRDKLEKAVANPEVKNILLHIASGGGEVPGVFDLVDEIYEARKTKKIIAFVDEAGFSAAYAIASAAHEIWLPRTGEVGSIGVLFVARNISGYLKKEGIKYEYIYEGAKKIDFSPYVPVTKEAREEERGKVKVIYDLFTSTVARNRDMDEKIIRETEAGTYMGQAAIDIGLADKIVTHRQAIEQLNLNPKEKEEEVTFMGSALTAFRNVFAGEHSDEDIEKALARFGYIPRDSLQVEKVDTEEVKVEAVIAAGTDHQKEAIATAKEVAKLCAEAGLPEMTAELIGMTAEEAGEKIQAAKATQSDKETVTSHVSATSTGEVNPLMANMAARFQEGK